MKKCWCGRRSKEGFKGNGSKEEKERNCKKKKKRRVNGYKCTNTLTIVERGPQRYTQEENNELIFGLLSLILNNLTFVLVHSAASVIFILQEPKDTPSQPVVSRDYICVHAYTNVVRIKTNFNCSGVHAIST